MIESDPGPAVELYFRQCALQLDARDLALMAATLANGGVQPRTGERVFEPEVVERVLSVMTTCGMYDAAGEWVVDVGLPAKSGVGGGVLAVLPGQVGIALYSPRLDRHGNSVRGVAACRQISRELELHFLHVASDRRSAIRDAWDVGSAPSSRRRTPDEQEVLNEYGACARVYALHGDLLFAGAESVVREFTERAPELEVIVLDISRVAEIAGVARRMLAATRAALEERGCRLALVDPDGELTGAQIEVFDDPDEATAWAEDRLIERHGGTLATTAPIALAEHGLAGDLRPDELGALRPLLERRSVAAGELIVSAGDEPGRHLLHRLRPGDRRRHRRRGNRPPDRGPPGRHQLRQARGHLRRAARDRRPRRHGPRPVRAHPGRDARARAALAAHRDRAAAHDVHAAARGAGAAGPRGGAAQLTQLRWCTSCRP